MDHLPAPDVDRVLEPGDLLSLPARWWPRVDTLEPSIAVNRWGGMERLGRRIGAMSRRG